ncbi:MAG: HIT family protein [Opitutaceae bacterium]|jgi:ATP adenylyltransferase
MESPFASLHPYWRMEYVARPKEPQTPRPFSDLPRLGDDRTALIVHRSRLSYLMLNRFPYNPGHLLAIPFREVDDLEALSAEEGADLLAEITFGKRLLRVVMKPDAFNIGFNLGRPSGGSIDHLHAHIVPRWTGDTNFMPVLGDTRILPESLDATWGKLAEAARALSSSSA